MALESESKVATLGFPMKHLIFDVCGFSSTSRLFNVKYRLEGSSIRNLKKAPECFSEEMLCKEVLNNPVE